MDTKTLKRFLDKVNKLDKVTSKHVDSACWLWTACLSTTGYGRLSVGGRKGGPRSAHRLAYEHWVGSAEGLCVCHKCDTPTCVNPQHLFAGTQLDNIADMVAKGRVDRSPMPKGELSPTAKLSRVQAESIISLYASGLFSHRSLANSMKLKASTVTAVITGQNWPHLDREALK